MQILKGIMISPGIAIGPVCLHSPDTPSVPQYEISPGQVSYELERFDSARRKAVQDVNNLLGGARPELGDTERQLLESHRLMLEDTDFVARVERELKSRSRNVEWVLGEVVQSIASKLQDSDSPYLRERSADIQDVANRIVSHLLYQRGLSPVVLAKPSVVVAHNLLPSELR